jgi:hypothetical protein
VSVDAVDAPTDLVGLDEAMRAAFRERALPAPVGWARGGQHRHDERRFTVPVTVVRRARRPDGGLERQREAFGWNAGGLDADGLARRLPPSTVTPGGLLKHLAFVERYYYCYRLFERPLGEPFVGVDWDSAPDWDWRTAADDIPQQLHMSWLDAVAASRRLLAEWLADGGLDRPAASVPPRARRRCDRSSWGLVEEDTRHGTST